MTMTEVPQWTIQDRLRKAREQAGMTQRELADAIGVAKSTISNYEAGTITHQRKIVMNQWALVTGVPVAWLWGDDTPSDQGVTASGCYADAAA